MALLLGRYCHLGLALPAGGEARPRPRLGPVLGFFVLLASAALNLITPTARLLGGMMRARYFARAQGRPFSLLYGVVLYDQVAHHSVMSVCTWIVLIAAAFVLHQTAWGFLLLAALIVTLAALAVWSRRARQGEEVRSSASSPAGPSAARGSSSACSPMGTRRSGSSSACSG